MVWYGDILFLNFEHYKYTIYFLGVVYLYLVQDASPTWGIFLNHSQIAVLEKNVKTA